VVFTKFSNLISNIKSEEKKREEEDEEDEEEEEHKSIKGKDGVV
jgi:hypothetical protein